MPLDLDKISLFAPNSEMPFEPVTFFDKLKFSVMKFLISFFTDYNAGQNSSERDELTVWVNWGRDQAQILNSMASGDFTAKTGIKVNIKLVSASIVQARLSRLLAATVPLRTGKSCNARSIIRSFSV